jgi:hypothetical protein
MQVYMISTNNVPFWGVNLFLENKTPRGTYENIGFIVAL